MKTMQTQLFQNDSLHDLKLHKKERTQEGTETIKIKQRVLKGNCRKLVKFWQEKWYFLTSDNCYQVAGVRNITQRAKNLIQDNGIPVEIKWHDPDKRDYKVYRLKCTCHLIGGVKESQGCYVHSEELKLK